MQTAPFGSWTSPITAQSLTSGAVGISEAIPDGDDVWWVESRPDEGGRNALMRWSGGETVEVTPPDANVRTAVHEYGGGSWWVQDGTAYYVEYGDQRLRKISAVGEPEFLSPEPAVGRGLRFADGRVCPCGQWFICVRETHSDDGSEAVNEVAAVATDGSFEMVTLASGADFYATPRVSPDGTKLVWVQWNHPDMPWDVTELWTADIEFGERSVSTSGARKLVGNGAEALQEPQWSADGGLRVATDRSEWWSLYSVDVSTGELTLDVGGDYEMVTPHWVFGLSHYADRVHKLADGQLSFGPPTDYTTIGSIYRSGDAVTFVGLSYETEAEVVRVTEDAVEVIRSARDLGLDSAFFEPPEAIGFPTGPGGEATAHALFYAPANPEFAAPPGEAPPLIVMIHGGPTAAARRQIDLGKRFWTSRGFGVVDVDYRGSTGYGRTYRHLLHDNWGIADVEDAVAAATYLAERGSVDGERLLIRGGSAGGYTTLAALAHHDSFAAGASHFGVADLTALATHTHKFESRYLDSLIGPYPEREDLYIERSPLTHAHKIAAALIVFQGDKDAVVPPAQSEMIVDALKQTGTPVEYHLFEGEQHGFRKAENIIAALEAELAWYGKVLGFEVSP